jgi:hypothetical protein
MLPLDASAEEAVIKTLQRTSPCSLGRSRHAASESQRECGVRRCRSDVTKRPIVASPPRSLGLSGLTSLATRVTLFILSPAGGAIMTQLTVLGAK